MTQPAPLAMHMEASWRSFGVVMGRFWQGMGAMFERFEPGMGKFQGTGTGESGEMCFST